MKMFGFGQFDCWQDEADGSVHFQSPVSVDKVLGGLQGPDIASAATIAPTALFHGVSGVAAIVTITNPPGFGARAHMLFLNPTGLWTWTAAGNIAIAGSAVVNKLLVFMWDTVRSKYNPSNIA